MVQPESERTLSDATLLAGFLTSAAGHELTQTLSAAKVPDAPQVAIAVDDARAIRVRVDEAYFEAAVVALLQHAKSNAPTETEVMVRISLLDGKAHGRFGSTSPIAVLL